MSIRVAQESIEVGYTSDARAIRVAQTIVEVAYTAEGRVVGPTASQM